MANVSKITTAVSTLIGQDFIPTSGQERQLASITEDTDVTEIISGFESQLADICNDIAAPYEGLNAEDIPLDVAAECLELDRFIRGFASNNIYSMVNKLSRDATLRLGEILGEVDMEEVSFFVLAYREILGREPDPEGLEFYENLEDEGIPVRVLLRDIINSPEALALDGL